MRKRFVIEFGMGIDLHGQNVQEAAVRAVNDAISKSCLIGLNEICHLSEENINEETYVEAIIGVSRPEEINVEEIKKIFPVGQVSVKVEKGGLKAPGLYFPSFGDKDNSVELAVACVIVSVDEL